MAMTITISGNYITLDDGVVSVDILKNQFEPVEVGEPFLDLTYSRANRGRNSRTVDYATTTVNGQTAGSASELKDLILNILFMAQDFFTEVRLGNIPGATAFGKFGYNADIDSASNETIWATPGVLRWTPMASADTLTIVSTAADDSAGGTGAETVEITGIDENRLAVTKQYTLTGTTPVVTTGDLWLGVNRIRCKQPVGSNKTNVGGITVTATTATTVQGYIVPNEGITNQMIFNVPSNTKTLLYQYQIDVAKIAGGSSPLIVVYLYATENGVLVDTLQTVIDSAVQNSFYQRFTPPLQLTGGGQTHWEVVVDTDTNNTFARSRIDMITFDV